MHEMFEKAAINFYFMAFEDNKEMFVLSIRSLDSFPRKSKQKPFYYGEKFNYRTILDDQFFA